MKHILCVGSVTVDVIVKPVDSLPAPGVLQAVSGISTHVGGCAANAANDLGLLGVPVSLACKVGADSFGEMIVKEAAKNGVDTAGIVTGTEADTTVSVVCSSSTGERSFLYNPGSAAAFTVEDIPEEVYQKADIIFIGGAFLLHSFDGEPAAKFMERARRDGKMTIMDTAWDSWNRWLPAIQPVLPHLDLFMPSYDEAVKITGETDLDAICDRLFALGSRTVIVKTGKDGAYICEDFDTRYALPTYTHIKPVDTTGAGDSFCAGFMAGLAQGWDYRRSGEFANAVGTHCIMAIGASSGIKPIAEILAFMERETPGK